MTNEKIIEMAKEAGIYDFIAYNSNKPEFIGYLTKFSELIVSSMQTEQPKIIEAVGEIVSDDECGKSINWLLEGGIAEFEIGDTLYASNEVLTDENGIGELYTRPAPSTVTSMQGDSEPLTIRVVDRFNEGYRVNGKWFSNMPTEQEIKDAYTCGGRVKGVSDELAGFEAKFKPELSRVVWGGKKYVPQSMYDDSKNAYLFSRMYEAWQARSQLSTPSDSTNVNDAIDGYVLVPVEPTDEMIEAGKAIVNIGWTDKGTTDEDTYKHMIAAARKP